MTEEFMLPAIAFSIYYFVAFIKQNETVNYLLTILLGMSFGWVFMLKFNHISVFAAIGFILFLSLCSRKQYRTLFHVIICGSVGVALSLLPSIIFFWKHDLFSSFFDAYIIFNMKYAGNSAYQFSRLYRLIQYPEALILPCFSGLILATRKEKRKRGDNAIVFFIFTVLLIDFILVWSSHFFFDHYLMPSHFIIIVAVALLINGFAPFFLPIMNRIKEYFARHWLAVSISGFALGILCILFAVSLGGRALKEFKYAKSKRDMYVKDEKVCALLNQYGNKLIVIDNACIFYRIYDATPDSKYLYQEPIFKSSEKMREEFEEEIRRKKPHLFLLPPGRKMPQYYDVEYLQDNYRSMECMSGTLFVRNEED